MQPPPTSSTSPFAGIQLAAGMPRAEAEQRIAKALGKERSEYSPYGNNLRGGTVEYVDASGHHVLEVIYKPGAPAPWEIQPDGNAVHREPIDESIASFRTFTR